MVEENDLPKEVIVSLMHPALKSGSKPTLVVLLRRPKHRRLKNKISPSANTRPNQTSQKAPTRHNLGHNLPLPFCLSFGDDGFGNSFLLGRVVKDRGAVLGKGAGKKRMSMGRGSKSGKMYLSSNVCKAIRISWNHNFQLIKNQPFPCRFGVVGSWNRKKNLTRSSYLTRSGLYSIKRASAWPVVPEHTSL